MKTKFDFFQQQQEWKQSDIQVINEENIILDLSSLIPSTQYINIKKISFLKNSKKYFYWEKGKITFLTQEPANISNLILDEHRKLLQIIGGPIIEASGFKDEFFCNIVEFFSCDTASLGLSDDILYYIQEKAKEEHKNPSIKFTEHLFTFAYEANGNRLLYDPYGMVYYYAKDHCSHFLEDIENFPSYTLYRIKKIKYFNSYIQEFFDIIYKADF